ncbi:hypothetical protein JCM11641_000355 [Rhodosporidiobolus odoratus]
MSTTLAYHIVDAFTTRPFAGNPASVVLFSEKEDEQKLAAVDDFTQALAAEFNLSNTAFVHAGMNLIFTQPAPAGSGYDTYSRVFVPNVGVDEDPVTGVAHTSIAPFWLCYPDALSRLHGSAEIKVSKTLRAKQVSKRGGEMVIVLDEAKGRVELRGGARTVMKGEVLL